MRRLLRPVVRPVRQAIREARRAWELHQVEPFPRRPGETVRVSYGHAGFPRPLPGPEALVSGGAVKYRYLDRRLPHAGLRFDVLYAVSSSRCQDLERLARVAQERGAKVVWNQNGICHPQNYLEAPQLNAAMGQIYRLADYVFYQSQFCLDSAQLFLGERTGPGEVLYNAVDTRHFVPCPVPLEARRELRLLMAGSHYSDYRLPCGIRTLATVRRQQEARLLIAGRVTGDLEHEARSLITDLRLEPFVEFLGPYTQTEAPSVYQRGDIYLHTKYLDPCPSAVIEAMACGLPVVHSQSGGTVELVGDEAGAGTPAETSWSRDFPPDPEQMAASVLAVADALPKYSRAARQRAVSRFDLEPWLQRHVDVFEMLADRAR